MAIIARKESYKKYYEDPNVCKHCSSIIQIPENGKASATKRKTFCNQSCSTTYNNLKKGRQPGRIAINNSGICLSCLKNITFKKLLKGGYYRRDYCTDCNIKNKSSVYLLTKKELFEQRGNWQSARSAIAKHARRVYELSGKDRKCMICQYDKHVNISHIKAVRDFGDDALVTDINHISNLTALCPNHHWEFDNGILQISGRVIDAA